MVTVDETTGVVTRLDKLGSDGRTAELSFEGGEAMAIAYGIPPEVAAAILAGGPGTMVGAAASAAIDPVVLDACRRYASIPYAFSYWQGYADATAQAQAHGLG